MMIMIHKFVEHMPDVLDEGTIYVSIPFETVIHKCACGCGAEVVTPLSPAEWSLIFDGETISLKPSIGSWSLECKSHYWIRKNKIEWSSRWSEDEIEMVKNTDLQAKKDHYQNAGLDPIKDTDDNLVVVSKKEKSFWDKVRSIFYSEK